MFAAFGRLLGGLTLATRISILIVVIMTFGLVVAGIGTVSILRDTLVRQVDDDLDNALQGFNFSDVAPSDVEGTCEFDQTVPNSYVLAVLDPQGEALCSNRPETGAQPDLTRVTLPFVASQDAPFTVPNQLDSTEWRVVARPITMTGTNNIGILVIAASLEGVRYSSHAFSLIYSGFSVISLILGAALTRVLAESALRGLRRVATTAEQFAEGDYEQRIEDSSDSAQEVVRLNSSLNVMLGNIQEAIKERDGTVAKMRDFIGDASHELRTPLVTVRGYAELYRMGAIQTPEDVASAMDRIESEAKRMARLVEDLLTLARLDEKRPPQQRSVDLVPIVAQATSDARAQAPERIFRFIEVAPEASSVVDPDTAEKVEQVFSPPPVMPPAVIIGDENAIRQVIANLITNALRYTPAGTPIDLGLGVSWQRREAVIHVIDYGPGIPEQLRSKIFERFYRTDKSRARETGGSGLGLAIVASIVHTHHGRVDVVETAGGGATFRIALPLADESALSELAGRIRAEQTTTSGRNPQR